MDKAILKKFAIESRQDLMSKIEKKIKTFYVDEEFTTEQKGDIFILANDKHTLSLSNEDNEKRNLLIKRINELSLEQVIEEASYTWFNRIIAIRYMEINDMIPLTKDNQSLGIRVLSSKDNAPDPEILKFSNLINPDLDINFNKEIYVNLKDDNDKFKYVLLLICKKLGKVIPQVFDGVTDYIDILIPDNLLNDTGFITKIVTEVPEENYSQVEIIGWLYQYYNQDEKDRVISAKKSYKKTEIPYATQLFTPDWIVKYMVENSLGKYWAEHSEKHSIEENWRYFIKDNIEYKKETKNPTDITFIDPCCGSGHILVYAIELFYQMYLETGYNKNDIPNLILKNNLFGLDIDDRAGQLSILSVLLKAREYDKNIFNKDVVKNLNIISIQESNTISEKIIDNLPSDEHKAQAKYLIDIFKNAKDIGSLLLIEERDYSDLENFINSDYTIFNLELKEELSPLIKIANILTQKYNVVVTNPPYLNNGVMNSTMKAYLNDNYSSYKTDLFSCFVYKNTILGKNDAYLGFMTPNVWMFLNSYEKLRNYIIKSKTISSFILLAKGSFFREATVDLCTFVLKNNNDNADEKGNYIRLEKYKGDMSVQENAFLKIINNGNEIFKKSMTSFQNISGNILAFWISDSMSNTFINHKVKDYAECNNGFTTGDNDKFLRLWHEVSYSNISLDTFNLEDSLFSEKKWYPYNKGGAFRKWYGNNDYLINWKNNGYDIKSYGHLVPRSMKYQLLKSITWSKICSGKCSFRCKLAGSLFDVAGLSMFPKNYNNYYYLLGLMNSVYSQKVLELISPTLNYETGHISSIPCIINEAKIEKVEELVKQNIELSKEDWDYFETSWDFKKHPLVSFRVLAGYPSNGMYSSSLEITYNYWKSQCDLSFNKLKVNEEELNRIFIDIYGLQDELTPDVDDKDITIRKADKARDVKSLISYAVGCMFGRYSLDKEGLIYAGGEFDESEYKLYKVDTDNIIPITDESYFGDDIVERFKEFVRIVYGRQTFNENLDFIAEALGKKGTETSEETIRRYFNNDFYSDHLKIYQKKPIYWLFDSGKKKGFKCLIYMHRYSENLVPKVRLDYLHRIQNTYEKLLSDVNYKLTTELSLNEKKEAQKRQAELNAKLQETKEYDEKIAHIANQTIKIDLDDGVTANYSKFADILAKIK